jgi:transposase
MKTLSLDLRERILAAYDAQQGTREEIGRRFRVSIGMVKKLQQQRRRTGEIGPRHYRSGRKPLLLQSHRERLGAMIAHKPDITLAEMRAALQIDCTLPAIHYVLRAMGLTYKKRVSMRASRIGPTSPAPDAGGSGSKPGSIPPGSFSSTSRRPKQI